MAAIFTEHANKLVEVANLGCSMSNNDDGVKMVRYAASQIENLCPQVGFEPFVQPLELESFMAVLHYSLFAIRPASSTQIMLR